MENGLQSEIWKNINRDETWESQASISPDGQVLFFVSDRRGCWSYDIYCSTRDVNGNWRLAENLGKIINTDQNEKHLLYTAMGKLCIFFTGHLGMGGYDIFCRV